MQLCHYCNFCESPEYNLQIWSIKASVMKNSYRAALLIFIQFSICDHICYFSKIGLALIDHLCIYIWDYPKSHQPIPPRDRLPKMSCNLCFTISLPNHSPLPFRKNQSLLLLSYLAMLFWSPESSSYLIFGYTLRSSCSSMHEHYTSSTPYLGKSKSLSNLFLDTKPIREKLSFSLYSNYSSNYISSRNDKSLLQNSETKYLRYYVYSLCYNYLPLCWKSTYRQYTKKWHVHVPRNLFTQAGNQIDLDSRPQFVDPGFKA